MTWLAQDVLPTAKTPLPDEEPIAHSPHVPPVIPLSFVEIEDPGTDWMTGLSPAERDSAQRAGFFPMQQWDRWRQRLTRDSDGIL